MKKRTMPFLFKLALAALIVLIFSGCSAESKEIYDSALKYRESMDEKIKDLSDGAQASGKLGFENMESAAKSGVSKLSTQVGLTLNKIGPIVIGVSLILGIILFAVTKRTAAIKLHQSALTLFIIGIPAVMLILMYGFAFLSSWFS